MPCLTSLAASKRSKVKPEVEGHNGSGPGSSNVSGTQPSDALPSDTHAARTNEVKSMSSVLLSQQPWPFATDLDRLLLRPPGAQWRNLFSVWPNVDEFRDTGLHWPCLIPPPVLFSGCIIYMLVFVGVLVGLASSWGQPLGEATAIRFFSFFFMNWALSITMLMYGVAIKTKASLIALCACSPIAAFFMAMGSLIPYPGSSDHTFGLVGSALIGFPAYMLSWAVVVLLTAKDEATRTVLKFSGAATKTLYWWVPCAILIGVDALREHLSESMVSLVGVALPFLLSSVTVLQSVVSKKVYMKSWYKKMWRQEDSDAYRHWVWKAPRDEAVLHVFPESLPTYCVATIQASAMGVQNLSMLLEVIEKPDSLRWISTLASSAVLQIFTRTTWFGFLTFRLMRCLTSGKLNVGRLSSFGYSMVLMQYASSYIGLVPVISIFGARGSLGVPIQTGQIIFVIVLFVTTFVTDVLVWWMCRLELMPNWKIEYYKGIPSDDPRHLYNDFSEAKYMHSGMALQMLGHASVFTLLTVIGKAGAKRLLLDVCPGSQDGFLWMSASMDCL